MRPRLDCHLERWEETCGMGRCYCTITVHWLLNMFHCESHSPSDMLAHAKIQTAWAFGAIQRLYQNYCSASSINPQRNTYQDCYRRSRLGLCASVLAPLLPISHLLFLSCLCRGKGITAWVMQGTRAVQKARWEAGSHNVLQFHCVLFYHFY